jgi:hypothetical protein
MKFSCMSWKMVTLASLKSLGLGAFSLVSAARCEEEMFTSRGEPASTNSDTIDATACGVLPPGLERFSCTRARGVSACVQRDGARRTYHGVVKVQVLHGECRVEKLPEVGAELGIRQDFLQRRGQLALLDLDLPQRRVSAHEAPHRRRG